MASALSMPLAEPSLQMRLPSEGHTMLMPQPPGLPKGTMGSQRDRLRIDPKRALEPTRKKLSTLESQRIMAVVLDSIRRMELMSVLPIIIKNIEKYSIAVGSDLIEALEKHKVILDSYADLHATVDKLSTTQTNIHMPMRSHTKSTLSIKNSSHDTDEEDEISVTNTDHNIEITVDRPGMIS